MKYVITNKTLLLSLLLMIYGITLDPKNESCKVLLNEISDSYEGDCKDGLAEGKGEAKGIDDYKGKFKNGLPDGKGKYIYQNGNVFTGNFKNGLKHGSGKFVFSLAGKSYTQKGYWVDGDYIGLTKIKKAYRIIMQNGIDKIEINKLNTDVDKLKVSFLLLHVKHVPKGLKINSSSGHITQIVKDFIISNSKGTNFIEIEYVITKGGQNKVCLFSFEILEKGSYEVIITNE